MRRRILGVVVTVLTLVGLAATAPGAGEMSDGAGVTVLAGEDYPLFAAPASGG